MMFLKTFFLLSILSITTILPAQRLVFNAFLGDNPIGTMIVTRTEGPDGVTYTSVTDLMLFLSIWICLTPPIIGMAVW